MRQLKTKDTFTMSKILKQMNLKFDAKDEKGKLKNQAQFGLELFMNVIENMHLAEKEVNEFLADLLGMTVAEFEDLDIDRLDEVFELFKGQKGFKVFSRLLS